MQGIRLGSSGAIQDVDVCVRQQTHALATTVVRCDPKCVRAGLFLDGVNVQREVLQKDLEALNVSEGGTEHERRVVDTFRYFNPEVDVDLLASTQIQELIMIIIPNSLLYLYFEFGQVLIHEASLF
jgi:hypothetical protein